MKKRGSQGHVPACGLAGANVGFSTVLFKLLWPNATVVCLEPDAGNFAVLQRNIQG
jgi:FkbM family methyltransferase